LRKGSADNNSQCIALTGIVAILVYKYLVDIDIDM